MPKINDKNFLSYYELVCYAVENNLDKNYIYSVPHHVAYYTRSLIREKLGITISVEDLQKLINSELRNKFITFNRIEKENDIVC